jgi:hypothetical protein
MHRFVRFCLVVGLAGSLMFLVSRLQGLYWPGNQQDYEPVQPIEFSHKLHAGKLEIACQYCHFGADQSRHAGIPPASLCMNCHGLVTSSRDLVLKEYRQAQQERRTLTLESAVLAWAGPHVTVADSSWALHVAKEPLTVMGRPARPVVSAELAKLYDALGLDDRLQPDPAKQPQPIAWVRIHKLPAFTCFDHRPHVAAGVDCQHCHGKVETMDRVRQVTNLSMGWCVNCHRDTAQNGVAGKKVKPSTDCSACHY